MIVKVFKFIYGFILFKLYRRTLDFNTVVKGKRVAVVGAASSAYHTGKGDYIDGFDIVIRINKAPQLLKDAKGKEDIGVKADVLFHSFYENTLSGGGPVDLALFDRLGIKYIINPIAAYGGYRVVFNFYKKYLAKRVIYTLPEQPYKLLLQRLEGFQPTIGFCALKSVVESEAAEVYITGFTFFKTGFGAGYRDDMKEPRQVQKYIMDAGLHNPDKEFNEFLVLLKANARKNIILDDTLRDIVNQHP